MASVTPLSKPSQTRIAVLLFILMSSIYFITYNGRIESGDTLSYFNGTASLVNHHDLLLDISAWSNEPPFLTSNNGYPLNTLDTEPLQIVLAALPFTIAENLTGIGLVHAVWLFNIFICALIVVVFFLYARTLGYSDKVALVGAVLLGVGTIIWPYSKSFFREPLAALLILITALFIERWRRNHYRLGWAFFGGILTILLSYYTKDAVILLSPALLLLAIPSPTNPRYRLRLHQLTKMMLILLFIFLTIILIAAIFQESLPVLNSYYTFLASILRAKPAYAHFFLTILHSYLLSIGGSLWGTSPIGLLAIPGLWMLYRRHQYRYIIIIPVAIIVFAAVYARFRGAHWFGGLSWPPRFLIPLVPFMLLGTLPALDHLLNRPVPRWIKITVGLLVLYSLWIQINGVSLDWGAYNAGLPPEANGLGEWGGGLNLVRYLRWIVIPALWSSFPLDFAWIRNNVPLWPIASGIIALSAAAVLWRSVRGNKHFRLSLWILTIALFALIYLSLRTIYNDGLYLGDNQSLHDIIPVIEANTSDNDVLILPDNNYASFFLNYGKFSAPRVIALPDQPGEQSAPDQPPQIRSDNVDMLLLKTSVPMLNMLAENHPRLWLLADTGTWISWSIRPVERFMVTHYYPIREFSTNPPDPNVRLIEYSTVHAPDPYAFRGADYVTDFIYNQSVHLMGFNLPQGTTYKPGDVLPISLYWLTDSALTENYTIAWFIADSQGNSVAQGEDTQPAWGFAPTTTWQPGIPLWDNHAVHLPGDLKAGSYHIWVRLYFFDSSGQLQELPAAGANVLNGTIGQLPVELTIAP